MFARITRSRCFLNEFSFYKYLSSSSKDITKSITNPTGPDYLLQNIKNATNPKKVLELVGSHHKIMNSKQLMQALRSLFTLQKYGNSNLSTQQVIQHPDFERLCYYLKAQAGMIELNETIEALKIVSYVGVQSNSTIIQVLLQLLRHNVNDLTLPQIIFLDFILRQFKSSPLVDGLLIALPIVFEVHLPTKIDRDNVAHLAEYLQFVSKKPISEKCVDLIVSCLIKYIDTHDILDVKIAKSIIWSICDMEKNEYFEPLLKKAIHTMLLNDIDKLDYNEIQTTMTKLIYKYSERYPFYYDQTLIDTCANYIVDNDLGYEEVLYTLRRLDRINHSNENLLNYLSTKCHENPEILTQASAPLMYIITTAMAMTKFKPVHWETVKNGIEKATCFENCKKRDILWVKLAASLCTLNIYKPEVLDKVFEDALLERTLKQNYLADFENLLLVYQTISTFEPDYKHLLPPKATIENIIAKLKPVLNYPLEGALQKGLGAENYVKTCLKTELGHHIDHLIVMRKGGYPVSLATDVQYLEEVDVPLDSQMILILALNRLHYTNNNKKMKSTSVLMIKTLEAKGYSVVPICMEDWNSLADFEKIPYLMQAIRLKMESNVRVSDTVC